MLINKPRRALSAPGLFIITALFPSGGYFSTGRRAEPRRDQKLNGRRRETEIWDEAVKIGGKMDQFLPDERSRAHGELQAH